MRLFLLLFNELDSGKRNIKKYIFGSVEFLNDDAEQRMTSSILKDY